jgi:hypothetical protein
MKIIQFDSSKMGTEYANGKESNIFNYRDGNNDVLVKLFKDDVVTEEEANNKSYREKKTAKLNMLSICKDDALVTVRGLVFKNNKLIGYTMDKVEGTKVDWTSKRIEKIILLKQIRENMLRLNANGIYIGEFDDKNFVVDSTGRVTHLDIDNYSVGGIDFETKDQYMERFDKTEAPKGLIDRYCFNIFTLALLGNYAVGYTNLHVMKLPISMRNRHNNDILDEMKCLDENYSGKLFKLTRKDGDN